MLQRLKLMVKSGLSAVTRRLLGPHVTALRVRSGDLEFLVDPEDYGVGRLLRLHGHYGEDELQRLRPLVGDDSDVLVVGTHVGTLAIPLAQKCRHVSAIEANPGTFGLLQANIAINDVNNIETYNIAASDRSQELTFLANRSNSGGSKIAPQTKDYRYYFDDPDEITVQGHQLDEILQRRSFDLIVMDIEGSEYFALRGMQDILASAKTLVVEFVPHHLRNVSGVTIEEFLGTVSMFDRLEVPVLGRTVSRDQFASVLHELDAQDLSDDGIVFSRS